MKINYRLAQEFVHMHNKFAIIILMISAFGSTIITYEEMVKIKPQVKRPRPIMFIGESN